MRRFVMNRWCAFVLALSVLITSTATFSPPVVYGDGLDPISISDGDTGSSGGDTTGPRGDPDGPGGPTQRMPSGRAVSSVGSGIYASRPAGDGGSALSVWTWRLHVVLRSLLRGWIRF